MPRRGVVLDPRARLGEQRVGRLAAAGHDEQVAVDRRARPTATERQPAAAPAAAIARRIRPRAGRGQPTISTPARSSASATPRPRSSADHDDRALAGLDGPVVDEPAHGARQHHADEVVAGKTSGCSIAPVATTIRPARKR